jgi:hypothetical protein
LLSEIERKCAELFFSGKRIERENVRLSTPFPFNRWGLIKIIVRVLGPRDERTKLAGLSDYLGDLSGIRWQMRNLPRIEIREMERVYLLGKWVRLSDSFVDGVARKGNLSQLYVEIEKAHKEVRERKAWLAFLRACVEVAWLASVFVFEIKKARRLEKARKLIRSGNFEESYQTSMQVVKQMKFGYAKAAVEKAVVYVGASILGIFAYQTSISLFVGILLFMAVFTALPYHAFTKLFYES